MWNGVTECGWRHAPEVCGGFWEVLKKSVSRVKTRHRTRRVDFRLLAEALGRCRTRWGWGRWKNQNRKIVPLSPYVEKPLNSKVIKSFVPELRSRKCFSCFEIPMFYIYIYINIPCTFRIFMYMAMVHLWHYLCWDSVSLFSFFFFTIFPDNLVHNFLSLSLKVSIKSFFFLFLFYSF